MSRIGTSVYDTAREAPADRVPVKLEKRAGHDDWEFRTKALTDLGGNIDNLLPEGLELSAGVYRLTFDTGSYFSHHGQQGFYPTVSVVFQVSRTDDDVHIPLRLSPDGYSTRHEAR